MSDNLGRGTPIGGGSQTEGRHPRCADSGQIVPAVSASCLSCHHRMEFGEKSHEHSALSAVCVSAAPQWRLCLRRQVGALTWVQPPRRMPAAENRSGGLRRTPERELRYGGRRTPPARV
ncbi:hypothetical protein AAFF_G00414910 [Aldrovandia affinis]|uniref:Uncharacterized protein n=1 Tax=Aldrovandia affinis TaxID=143900 RepID=A0AAD7SB68_9TELE|nr:hypothetical protein AAFF_G00414910 [Aldrovandia affinis]